MFSANRLCSAGKVKSAGGFSQLLLYSGKTIGVEPQPAMAAAVLLIFSSGIFGWGAMGSGQGKGFTSPEVQQIITKKHEAAQNKATGSYTDGFLREIFNPFKTRLFLMISCLALLCPWTINV